MFPCRRFSWLCWRMCVFICAALRKELMVVEFNAWQYLKEHFDCILTALYMHNTCCCCLYTHTHIHRRQTQPSRMFFCVATGFIADSWLLGMPSLMTCYSRPRARPRQESPPRWPSQGIRFPQIWATRLPPCMREAGVSIYSLDILMFGSAHVFFSTHIHTVPKSWARSHTTGQFQGGEFVRVTIMKALCKPSKSFLQLSYYQFLPCTVSSYD